MERAGKKQRITAGTEWQACSSEVRGQLEIGHGNNWAARPGTRGVPNSARQHDAVNIAYADHYRQVKKLVPNATVEQVTRDLFVDVNPSVKYRSWGWVKGMTTGSQYYSFELKRELEPIEHLLLLGFDTNRLDTTNLSSSDMRDLTGNAHSLLQTGIVMFSLLLNMNLPVVFCQS